MVFILGIVFSLLGIGCLFMSVLTADLSRQFGEPSGGTIAPLFGVGAFLFFACAVVLFVKAYRSKKSKK